MLNGWQDIGLLALRIAVGAIFIYHGLPKITGGKKMAAQMGKPNMSSFVTFLGLGESVAGIATIVGFLTQFANIGLALVMLGAIRMKISAWKVPFAAHDKTGWEFDFMLLGAAIALVFLGAGSISVDAVLNWWP